MILPAVVDKVPYHAPMGTAYPTVQLLHALPDGSSHVDWMLASDPDGGASLVTFRLERPVDELSGGRGLDAVRLPDHRPRYLDYEGPVSGGRGDVTRIRRGTIERWTCEAEAWNLEVLWTEPVEVTRRQRLRVTRRATGQPWHVTEH